MTRLGAVLAGIAAVLAIAMLPATTQEGSPNAPDGVDADCASRLHIDYAEDDPQGFTTPEEAYDAHPDAAANPRSRTEKRVVSDDRVVFDEKDSRGKVTRSVEVRKLSGQWVVQDVTEAEPDCR